MGNKFGRKSKQSSASTEKKSTATRSTLYSEPYIFPYSPSVDEEFINENIYSDASASITIPSVYTSIKSESMTTENQSEETNSITVDQMDNMFLRFKFENMDQNGELFNDDTLWKIRTIFSKFQDDILTKFDMESIPHEFLKLYGECADYDGEVELFEKFSKHMFYVICMYKVVLEALERDNEHAMDLITQLSIKHGLLNIPEFHFKSMDVSITRFLLQRGLINDETIVPFAAFLTMFSNHAIRILTKSKFRADSKLSQDDFFPRTGRNSFARENYRLMKKWKQEVEFIKRKAEFLMHRQQTKFSKLEDSVDSSECNPMKASECLIKFMGGTKAPKTKKL